MHSFVSPRMRTELVGTTAALLSTEPFQKLEHKVTLAPRSAVGFWWV